MLKNMLCSSWYCRSVIVSKPVVLFPVYSVSLRCDRESSSLVQSCSYCVLVCLESVRGKEQKRGACVNDTGSSIQEGRAVSISH